MANFVNFGNGQDSILNVTTSVVDVPIDSSCSGTVGASTVSATNASFVAGQMVFICQMRGTNVGKAEINYISSYTAGTVTLAIPLSYTYTDSGASQAQIIVVKQHSSINVSAGVTLTSKIWDGNVGGVLVLACSGMANILGTLSAYARGYAGGASVGRLTHGQQGEGTLTSGGSATTSSNGNGGGGGQNGSGDGGSGGGGSHYTSGGGGASRDGRPGGNAGGTLGGNPFTDIYMGGGGGSGSGDEDGNYSGYGGRGGGIVILISRQFYVPGLMDSRGQDGGHGSNNTGTGGMGGGAGAAGGTCYIIGMRGQVTPYCFNVAGGAMGRAGGNPPNDDRTGGGAGGYGVAGIKACSLTGVPAGYFGTYVPQLGGHSFCGDLAQIIG